MDLWEYTKLDDGTYALNSEETITAVEAGNWSSAQKGYKGTFTGNGEIEGSLPQYIKDETDDTFIEVTDLTYLFYNCTELKVMSQIPSTVKNMSNTFLNCNSLSILSTIPIGVNTLISTFQNCVSLTKTPNIPNTVVDMSQSFKNCTNLQVVSEELPNSVIKMPGTFTNCGKLVTIPNIPQKVENMNFTFQNCINLQTVPEIPNSVIKMRETFNGCNNLTGVITINANLNGKLDSEKLPDYHAMFKNAATNRGCEIKLTGTCPMLENIVNSTNKSNITLL